MGEHTQIQTQTQTQAQSQSQSQSQTHHETTTQPQPQQPTPPSETTTTTTTDTDLSPNHPPTSSKIPFRPRKIRKLSSDNSDDKSPQVTDGETSKSLTVIKESTKNNRKRAPAQSARVYPIVIRPLSCEGEIDLAIRYLRESDPLLAPLIEAHPPPTFDSFHPPFLALAKSILYQQLAYKAGTSIYTRFVALCGGEAAVLPDAVLALSPPELRQIGVSGRKASYLHDLANKYKSGILSDASVVEMDDKSLFTMLTMVKGIGSWSVHMFMIFSLHRPDVLPVSDLGVRKGVQLLYGLEDLPRPSQMEMICEKWKPYRSVASWYMWRFVEGKGSPTAAATAALVDTAVPPQEQQMQQHQTHTQQQQQQQQHQLQLLDPINGISNLGACIWGQ